MRVRLPRSLAARRYYVAVCVRTGRRSDCRLAARRLTVVRRTSSPQPQPQPQPPAPTTPPVRYDILAFTEGSSGNDSIGEAVTALRQLGARNRFRVTVANSSAGVFTEANLKKFRAVLFLNTAGEILNPAEQTAFEDYFKDGGGFLGIHSAIATEPDWPFLTNLLGTRATGAPRRSTTPRSRWPTGCTTRAGRCPSTGGTRTSSTTSRATYAGSRTCSPPWTRTPTRAASMGFDHPVAWCKDVEGGRSFYTALGRNRQAYRSDDFREHLAGAIAWTAGLSDPVYSDCGATVLANYQQVKITAPPNLNEPIGFDQLPDGRIIQTTRDGRVRLHDPATGTADVIASFPSTPTARTACTARRSTTTSPRTSWVYLFYSPLTMEGTAQSGKPYPAQTPPGNAPTMAADPAVFDEWVGYFQLSRFKFDEASGGEPAQLDLDSEQKIMKVEVDRGACCHVAGDIDFDKQNNLWLVTGDDTPAGSVGANQFPPYNDQKTTETQTVTLANATGGTFTLSFDGQTTAPIDFPLNNADIEAKLEALPGIENVLVAGTGAANRTVAFGGDLLHENVPLMTADASGLTSATRRRSRSPPRWSPTVRRAAQRCPARRHQHERPAREAAADQGRRRRLVRDPAGQPVPGVRNGNKTRPEIYAMGFRNPFRVQVDSDGVAYVTDYSPDSRAPGQLHAAGGYRPDRDRAQAVNYGWPMCYGSQLPMYEWDFNMQGPRQQFDCDDPSAAPANTSRWNTGLRYGPPITQPDIWYSYNDNATPPLGTPCLAYYDGSGGTCPQLFPELGTGGVGPHGAAKYEFDPGNPSETKFPPYYDNAVFFGEFTRDYLREVRLDSHGGMYKINNALNCGAFGSTRTRSSATTRWTCSSAPTATCTC